MWLFVCHSFSSQIGPIWGDLYCGFYIKKQGLGDFFLIYKILIFVCRINEYRTIKDTCSLFFWIFQISAQASFLVLFSFRFVTRLCSNKRFLVESRCCFSLSVRQTEPWRPVKFYLTSFIHINTNMVEMPRVYRWWDDCECVSDLTALF